MKTAQQIVTAEQIKQLVAKAIARSISHNEIVTIRESEGDASSESLNDALTLECEDSARSAEVTEYWGVDLDDNTWRVHVHADRAVR